MDNEEAIEALALAHYGRGLSSLTAKQVSRVASGSPKEAAAVLKRLEQRGCVERLDASKTRYRLVDPAEVAPFRAGVATDG